MKKLVFGCGYLGQRVARLWRDQGDQVYVVTRSARRVTELQREGYEVLVTDVTLPDSLTHMPDVTTVLFAVGLDRQAKASVAEVFAGGVKNVVEAMSGRFEQLLYISTTGVYGPAGGAWVDETTTPNPQRDSAKAALAAEESLEGRATILRLAGIYGPGRIPYLDQLRAGEAIAAPREGWLNLIHVDDAAEIVVAAEAWAKTHAEDSHVFCVSDGHPVVRGEYYREVARRIGAPPPQFTEPDPASPAAARAIADKRISNAKLQQKLPIEWKYPTYREGLEAILADA